MTRQEKIQSGKLWVITTKENPDISLYEGSKASCIKYLKKNRLYKNYLKGIDNISMGKLIWEKD